ncbi:MAG: exodeoxyribonuclease VII small subunit [Ilumatobacteraceae bacterium]
MATKKTDEIGYASALKELESILNELEKPDVDVDVLASKVERASELIHLCRERINNAQLQIEKAVDGLDS